MDFYPCLLSGSYGEIGVMDFGLYAVLFIQGKSSNFKCIVIFRLYSQLEEVKQRKAMEERQQIYAQNREKRKEFEKVSFSELICVHLSRVYTFLLLNVHPYILLCISLTLRFHC